jgi:hypothetical protein
MPVNKEAVDRLVAAAENVWTLYSSKSRPWNELLEALKAVKEVGEPRYAKR